MKDRDRRVNSEHRRNAESHLVLVSSKSAEELCEVSRGIDKHRGTTKGLSTKTAESSSEVVIGKICKTKDRASSTAVSAKSSN